MDHAHRSLSYSSFGLKQHYGWLFAVMSTNWTWFLPVIGWTEHSYMYNIHARMRYFGWTIKEIPLVLTLTWILHLFSNNCNFGESGVNTIILYGCELLIKSNQIHIYVQFGLPANQILNQLEREKISYFQNHVWYY